MPAGGWKYRGHTVKYMTVYHSAVHLRAIQNHTECKAMENKQTVKVLRNHCAALISGVRLGKVPHPVRVERWLSVTSTPGTHGTGFLSSLTNRGGGLQLLSVEAAGCALFGWFCGYFGEYSRQPPRGRQRSLRVCTHASNHYSWTCPPDPRSSQGLGGWSWSPRCLCLPGRPP